MKQTINIVADMLGSYKRKKIRRDPGKDFPTCQLSWECSDQTSIIKRLV